MRIHEVDISDPMIRVVCPGNFPQVLTCLVKGHQWPSGNPWPSPWTHVNNYFGGRLLEVACARCGRHLEQWQHEANPGGVRFHYE